MTPTSAAMAEAALPETTTAAAPAPAVSEPAAEPGSYANDNLTKKQLQCLWQQAVQTELQILAKKYSTPEHGSSIARAFAPESLPDHHIGQTKAQREQGPFSTAYPERLTTAHFRPLP